MKKIPVDKFMLARGKKITSAPWFAANMRDGSFIRGTLDGGKFERVLSGPDPFWHGKITRMTEVFLPEVIDEGDIDCLVMFYCWLNKLGDDNYYHDKLDISRGHRLSVMVSATGVFGVFMSKKDAVASRRIRRALPVPFSGDFIYNF